MDLNRLKLLSGIDLNESVTATISGDFLEESIPTDQQKFVKDAKAAFKKKYGERWKEVLYATAWERHDKEEKNESFDISDRIMSMFELRENLELDQLPLREPTYFIVKNTATNESSSVIASGPLRAVQSLGLKLSDKIGSGSGTKESPFTIDDEAGIPIIAYASVKNESLSEAEAPNQSEFPKVDFLKGDPANMLTLTNIEFEDDKIAYNQEMTGQDQEEEVKIKYPSEVKRQVKKRREEIKKSIEEYEDAGYGDNGSFYKSVKHNALDVLDEMDELLSKETLASFKEAQVYFGRLMSPIFDLLPSSLINFLATGREETKKKI